MKHKETTWGWMLAVDFFFAGMGGAMIALAGISYLFFDNTLTSVVGNFAGPVGVAIGAGLLIFELGRPFQAWRVFMNPKAILTFGAWNMTLSIGVGGIFASFAFENLPWASWAWAQNILAVLCVIFGLVVATYPGVLLGRHKGRPFWTGPGMINLFLLSSLLTAFAAHSLFNRLFTELQGLDRLLAVLLVLQIALWLFYLYVKATGTTTHEAEAAKQWGKGKYAVGFWGVLIGLGSVLPLILTFFDISFVSIAAYFLVLLGGLWMRLNVVYSGEARTWLPGEEFYLSRLPKGDEEFLKILK